MNGRQHTPQNGKAFACLPHGVGEGRWQQLDRLANSRTGCILLVLCALTAGGVLVLDMFSHYCVPVMEASVAASLARTASTQACRDPGTWARYLDSVAVISATCFRSYTCVHISSGHVAYLPLEYGQLVLDCTNLLAVWTTGEGEWRLLIPHLATGVACICMMELTSASCG